MEIRSFQDRDKETIVQIMNHAITEHANAYTEALVGDGADQWFEDLKTNARSLIVAESGNEIMGWGSLTPYRSGREALKHTSEITFYVHQSHRRQGVGKDLTKALIRISHVINNQVLIAILLDNNIASIQLLETIGFERWAALPNVARFEQETIGHFYYGMHLQ